MNHCLGSVLAAGLLSLMCACGGVTAGSGGSPALGGGGGVAMAAGGSGNSAAGGGGGSRNSISGSGGCLPFPTFENDPRCPSGGASDPMPFYGAVCPRPGLTCSSLAYHGFTLPCDQPPFVVSFVCCEGGWYERPDQQLAVVGDCPALIANQDARCPRLPPQYAVGVCSDLALECAYVSGSSEAGAAARDRFACCNGYWNEPRALVEKGPGSCAPSPSVDGGSLDAAVVTTTD